MFAGCLSSLDVFQKKKKLNAFTPRPRPSFSASCLKWSAGCFDTLVLPWLTITTNASIQNQMPWLEEKWFIPLLKCQISCIFLNTKCQHPFFLWKKILLGIIFMCIGEQFSVMFQITHLFIKRFSDISMYVKFLSKWYW